MTSVAAGNGLNFTTITGSGSVVLGTPTIVSATSTNSVTSTSHTHEFEKDVVILSKSASYTVVAADNGKVINCTGTINITIPTALVDGFNVQIINDVTGDISLKQGTSTTLNSKDGNIKLASRYGGASVIYTATSEATAIGDLTA